MSNQRESSQRQFNLLSDQLPALAVRKSPVKRAVIKSKHVLMAEPKSIIVNDNEFENQNNINIQPLTEAGEIKGVMHNCSCGQSVEILFDFLD